MPKVTPDSFNDADRIAQPYESKEIRDIAVSNNAYDTSIAPSTVQLINKSDYDKLIVTIVNKGAAALDFEIRGTTGKGLLANGERGVDEPPEIDSDTWIDLIPSSTETLASNESVAKKLTDNWNWIMIRIKRNGGSNTIADVLMRGDEVE